MDQPERGADIPWHFPLMLEDVPEIGKRFELTADADTRAAVARTAGLRDLPRLEVSFEVRRQGAGGLRVTGRISATVGQNCVVTLEPLASEVEENVDLLFAARSVAGTAGEEAGLLPVNRDNTEPLIDGRIDLGMLATEFLVIGLDPYPRKPGTVFQPPQDATPDEGPFAVLGTLKKDRDAR
jgi:hypothetical protein